jgi:hypothetical protein
MEDPRKQLPSSDQLRSLGRRDRFMSFGCGSFLGGSLGFLGAVSAMDASFGMVMATALLSAAVLGSLCAIFGEGLIERVVRWLSW